MKNVTISLNKQESKSFEDKARMLGLTEYALAKKLVTDFLYQNKFDEKAVLYEQIRKAQKKHRRTILFVYGLSCYVVVSLACILLFIL